MRFELGLVRAHCIPLFCRPQALEVNFLSHLERKMSIKNSTIVDIFIVVYCVK